MKTLATLDSKAIAVAALCQAKDDVRFYLNGIYCRPAPDGKGGVQVCATDGHRLVIVTDRNGICEEPFIIRFDPTSITKLKGTKVGHVTVVLTDSGDVHVTAYGIEGLSDKPLLSSFAEIVDGRYPDIDAVMPNKAPASGTPIISVNPFYLKDLCEVNKILGNKHNTISLFGGETINNAITCLFSASANPAIHVIACIMPVRVESSLHMYMWSP